ncbi:MAG: hypothetical protein J6S62_04470 [Bacteroidales bacterium]|nr:hypothetical protein [Bacteroidales bacterium]
MKMTRYLLPALLGLVLSSCYRDLSTEATFIIPDIVVTGVPASLDVVYGEEITVSAKAYMGEKSGNDFTYLWEIDLRANVTKDRVVIGEESTLTYTVANTPTSVPYLLSVRVTDPETGLEAMGSCFLTVRSSLGEGLLVGYTLPDGLRSEFAIAASPAITYGYEGASRITRGLYALANGEPYPEKLTCILQTVDTGTGVYSDHRILAGSTNHVFAINPLTFEVQEQDAQLFSSTTIEKFGPSIMFNSGGYASFMFIDSDAYSHLCNIDNVYAKMPNSIDNPVRFYPTNVGYAALDQGLTCVYNDGDAIYFARAWTLMGGGFSKLDTNGMLDFPLEGSKCIQGGCLRGMRPAFLVKDRDGAYHIVGVVSGNTKETAFSVSVEGENLDNLVSAAFCDNGDLMYYATGRDIYCAVISGNVSLVRKLNWKPENPGERITQIKQYTQAWYGTGQTSAADYGFVLPTHRNMLIIVTHNDSTGEGKFYLRGYNVSTGLFTFNGDYGSFSGFGEITAIAPTIR